MLLDRERLPGLGDLYASPVAAAGRVYVTDRDGTTLVLRQGGKLQILATNRLSDPIDASPVIVGRQLFLRVITTSTASSLRTGSLTCSRNTRTTTTRGKSMKGKSIAPLAAAAALAVLAAGPATQGAEDGFVPLFNGKDLTGWVNVNGRRKPCASRRA